MSEESTQMRWKLFFLNFLFYRSIVNWQCCDNFRWTAKGLSLTYTCSHSLPTPLPSRLPHNIEQSSLCYTVGPWLFILITAVCACCEINAIIKETPQRSIIHFITWRHRKEEVNLHQNLHAGLLCLDLV